MANTTSFETLDRAGGSDGSSSSFLRENAAGAGGPFQSEPPALPLCESCRNAAAGVGPYHFNGDHWFLCGNCALEIGPVLA